MLNQDLHKLAASLNLTDLQEQEPFILTQEEAHRAIEHAIIAAKKLAAWKMASLLKTQEEIEAKIREIEWEKRIDRRKVLKLANTAKLQDQWQKELQIKRRQDQAKEQMELKEFWTYTRVYNLMKWTSENVYGKLFLQTADNETAIKAICFFISRNDRFIDELKFNGQKGLLLRGPTGTGKTHLVRCVENNGLNPIYTQSMLEITDTVKTDGEFKFSMNGQRIIYLDDVGTEEPIVNFYGTKISWFKNFIESVYLRTTCFNHLIISTNLNFKDIGEYYGFRVASRMREMFNVIDLKGKDLRDKKNQA